MTLSPAVCVLPTHACPRGWGAIPPPHRLNPFLAGSLGVPVFSSKISASFITEFKKKKKRNQEGK